MKERREQGLVGAGMPSLCKGTRQCSSHASKAEREGRMPSSKSRKRERGGVLRERERRSEAYATDTFWLTRSAQQVALIGTPSVSLSLTLSRGTLSPPNTNPPLSRFSPHNNFLIIFPTNLLFPYNTRDRAISGRRKSQQAFLWSAGQP